MVKTKVSEERLGKVDFIILDNKNMYQVYRYFVITTIVISLLANFIISFQDNNLLGIFALRNFFLLIFLSCFICYKKWSLGVLIILCVLYWYFFIATANASYNNHPISDYTNGISELFKSGRKIFLLIPFIVNVLILTYDIPSRVLKLRKRVI